MYLLPQVPTHDALRESGVGSWVVALHLESVSVLGLRKGCGRMKDLVARKCYTCTCYHLSQNAIDACAHMAKSWRVVDKVRDGRILPLAYKQWRWRVEMAK